jgi:hypothetical protein
MRFQVAPARECIEPEVGPAHGQVLDQIAADQRKPALLGRVEGLSGVDPG